MQNAFQLVQIEREVGIRRGIPISSDIPDSSVRSFGWNRRRSWLIWNSRGFWLSALETGLCGTVGFELTNGRATGRGLSFIDRFLKSVATPCTASLPWVAPELEANESSGGGRFFSSSETSWR